MVLRILTAALASIIGVSTVSGEILGAYFGTYTGGASEGIYYSTFDNETGELSKPVLAAKLNNPSFVEIHPSGRYLYAVSEAGTEGVVTAFSIDSSTGKLTQINQQPSGGSGPCHVNVDHAGRNVLVANYNSGSASVIPIAAGGALARPTGFVQHEGSSVNQRRQKGPHAHSINVSADDRFAFVADLGIDKLMVYKLDVDKGTITPNDPAFAKLADGAGPRHFAFSPNGRFAYVINELSCTMTVFAYDSRAGAFDELQTITTLPDGFEGNNSCAEVRVHPSGRFVYGSNRGHNSIVVYRVDRASGKLTFVEHETAGIKTPRNFNIEPSGGFCLVANQDADSILVLRINRRTGTLEPTGGKIAVGKPVCIRFLARD